MTHSQVAAAVRKRKEAFPEFYCKTPGCLWNTRLTPCKNHLVKPEPTLKCSACDSQNVSLEQAEDGQQGTEYHAIAEAVVCRDCGAKEQI